MEYFNPFGTFMEQQQNLYKSWADQFKKAEKKDDTPVTPLDMYKDMLNNYEEWFSRMSSMVPNMKQFTELMGFNPDWTQMWKMYEGMMPNWNQMQNMMPNWDQMQKMYTNMMPNWDQMQKMMPNWDQMQKMMPNWDQMQKAYAGMMPNFEEMQKAYANMMPNWDQMQKAYAGMMPNFEEMQKAYAGMMPNFEEMQKAYANMMPNWDQVQKAYAGITPSWEQVQKMYANMTPNWEQMQKMYAGMVPNFEQMQKMYTNMMPSFEQMKNFCTGTLPTFEDIQKNFTGMIPKYDELQKMYADFIPNFNEIQNFYKAMMPDFSNVQKMFSTLLPGADAMKTMFSNVPGAEIYQKIFDFWAGMQNPEQFVNNFSSSYMDFMMDLLKSALPEGFSNFIIEPKQLMDSCVSFYKAFMSPWMNIDESLLDRIARGDATAYTELFTEINKTYDDTFGKLFTMEGFGINREANADELLSVNRFYKMIFTGAELISILRNGFTDGMVKLVERYKSALDEGKDIETFREFYDLWFNVNEATLTDLFNTDAFCQAFGAFSDAYAEFLIARNTVLERFLSNLPIPTKKDMDSLYKTVYDLRKDMYFVKKELEKKQ